MSDSRSGTSRSTAMVLTNVARSMSMLAEGNGIFVFVKHNDANLVQYLSKRFLHILWPLLHQRFNVGHWALVLDNRGRFVPMDLLDVFQPSVHRLDTFAVGGRIDRIMQVLYPPHKKLSSCGSFCDGAQLKVQYCRELSHPLRKVVSPVGSDCLPEGSSSITRPSSSGLPSGRGILIKPSMSPTAGM